MASVLTYMLRWWHIAILGSQVCLQNTTKEFKQDLEADLGNGRIVATLAELVTNKGVLSPGKLVEASYNTSFAELGTNEVPASVRDMCILDSENHSNFTLELVE